MNAWPTLREWFQFGGTLALELTVVFAVAKLVALRVRPAQGRRALWQIVVLAMLLVTVGELSGVRGWMRLPEKKTSSNPQTKVVVTFKDVEPSLEEFLDAGAVEAPLVLVTSKPALRPSRWQQHAVWPALLWAMVAGLILFRMLIAQVMAIALRLTAHRSRSQPGLLDVIAAEKTADMAVRSSNRVRRIAQLLGIRRQVVLLTSARTVAPFTFGVGRPVIVLPRSFATTFTPEQQDAALAHELAHVAGFDSAWRGLSQSACAVLWWFPLVWLARRELDHASELVADEASLLVANGPDCLAECLLACAKELRRPALVGWLGMDGGGFRSALGQRVTRLLQLHPHARLSRPVPWYLRLVAPIAFASLLWLGMSVVLKSGEPRGGAWRSSILGSAVAAVVENKVKAAAEPAERVRSEVLQMKPEEEWLAPVVKTQSRTNEAPPANTNAMHTRIFHIDPNTFQQGLDTIQAGHRTNPPPRDASRIVQLGKTNSLWAEIVPAEIVIPRLREFFKSLGVDFSVPDKAIYFNDQRGLLMVRATHEDLDRIEKGMQFLNMSPPQVTIHVKAMEVPVTTNRGAAMFFRGTNIVPAGQAFTSRVASVTGILTSEQYRQILSAMEKSGGVDLMNAPVVTTMSGRQTQIKVVEIRYVVTGLDSSEADKKRSKVSPGPKGGAVVARESESLILPVAEPFELGPVVDVIPYVNADGRTIQMTVLPSLKEFLGYDDPGTVKPAGAGMARYKDIDSPVPLPKFRLRQSSTMAEIWDGQTMIVGAGTVRNAERDRATDGTITTNYTDKALFFFITPRIIDPAGNVVNSEEELREMQKNVSPPKDSLINSGLRRTIP